ncbi:MAG: fibronectin type III domain-containing protein [Bacteroidales bacterium]|nr:fibronectin type III domain-containing protein [Bacteroidales bacterium]
MKKLLNLLEEVLNPRLIGIKTFVVLVLVTLFLNVNAQIINHTSGYPTGTIYQNCSASNCETIILPPMFYGEVYTFTILLDASYLINEINFDTVYTQSDCNPLYLTTSYDFDKNNGIIEITPGEFCNDNDTLVLNVSAQHAIDGTDFQIYKIPVNRLPVKTVLVLDISGSMYAIEASGDSRWDILKKSVEVFTRLHEIFRQEGDEIGMTYFTHYLIQPNAPIGNGFIEITPVTANPSTEDTIIKDMNARHPLAATSIGLGLLDAKTKLKSDVTNRYRKVAVLFTDGLQNMPPFINETDGNSTYGTGGGALLNDFFTDNVDSIRYYTIATWGATSGPTPQVLANIADNSNAHALVAANASNPPGNSVFQYFNANLENILHGGSPQIIGNKIGQLTDNEITHSFYLNSNISKAVFVLTHNEADDININIEKNSDDISSVATTINGSFYKIMILEFPVSDETPIYSEGEYKIKISGTTQDFYELTCIADDHYFDYECKIDNAIYKTGDTIRFSANLNYAGTPFTSQDDTVKVILLKPGDDINHLLAIYETPDIEDDEDSGTPAQEKFEYLYKNNPDFYDALLPQDQVIQLTNLGNGNFSGEYSDTYLTGIYEIIFLINGKDATKGTFKRKNLQSAVFKFGQSNPVDIDIVTDNIAPSAPSNLVSSNITLSTVDLNWYASMDISGISNYHVYQNGIFLVSTTDLNCSITGLNPGTSYEFYINAEDGFNNISDPSNTINATTLDENDILKPDITENLTVSNISQTSFYLSWQASSDNIGVTGYTIYKDGEPLINTTNINYSITGLSAGTNYSFYVTAKDFANNESDPSEELNITTLNIPEVISAPTKLTANDITETTLNLVWEASNSKVGVLKYYLYQDACLIASATGTNYYVRNLKPSTVYNFHVIAIDSEGNLSDASNHLNVSTLDKYVGKYGILGLKIRPKNKFGYYLGPGFKSIIKLKYIPKKPIDPIAHKSSIQDEPEEQVQMGDPYLKSIVDNLDGSYYLVLANVAPKTNPRIEISIDDEIVHSGPIYKIPLWFYIILVVVVIFLLILWILKQNKTKLFRVLWLLLILLLVIWILHYTGQLFFLFMI